MRIESYNQIQSIYSAQKAKAPQKAGTVAHATDRVQISSFGQDLATAKAALKETPDVREDITAPIKQQIQDGTYDVSEESFADKLLAKYQGL